METMIAAIETALAATLPPLFIADTSWDIRDELLQQWLHQKSHAIATVSWRRHVSSMAKEKGRPLTPKNDNVSPPGSLKGGHDCREGRKANFVQR